MFEQVDPKATGLGTYWSYEFLPAALRSEVDANCLGESWTAGGITIRRCDVATGPSAREVYDRHMAAGNQSRCD
jgi:hypothetical protein